MLERFITGVVSKSTDKLAVLCEGVNQQILSDEILKGRIKSIKIDWKEMDAKDVRVVPTLDVQFN